MNPLRKLRYIPVRYPFIYKKALKRLKSDGKTIYLSFDDGPNEKLTLKILDMLAEYKAKASFFCVGNNAIKHPDLISKILQNGHSIGNHSYSHKNAYKTSCKDWLEDVFRKSPVSDAKLFRPPYGKIKYSQYRKLKKKYQIVFWDVLSMDYNQNLTAEDVSEIVRKYTRNGSIIVFHDNPKHKEKMLPALENTLKHFSSEQYEFKAL